LDYIIITIGKTKANNEEKNNAWQARFRPSAHKKTYSYSRLVFEETKQGEIIVFNKDF